MDRPRIGIIGGTGVYDLPNLRFEDDITENTAYGEVPLRRGTYEASTGDSVDVIFMARHGSDHSVPPHRVNYRANVTALRSAGVHRVVATAAVGSLRADLLPGTLVLLDQFLDFTRGRITTFFDEVGEVRHTDMTEPYHGETRRLLLRAAEKAGVRLEARGTYVCTEGPRFETAAEVRAYGSLGGDIVGMTNVPEVVLAREIGLAYAAVALVTNLGAGISANPLTHEEVLEAMEANRLQLAELLGAFLEEVSTGEFGEETP